MEGDIINKLEEVKVIPMTYDYVFKSVLSENKEYLARILSNILNIDKDYILDNLVYKNTEHTKLSKKRQKKNIRFNSRSRKYENKSRNE